MPTIEDLGQKVKTKYPGSYDDIPNADLGKKIKTKFPGAYDDFTEAPPKPQGLLERGAQDVSLGWRSGMSHAATTAANVADVVKADGVAGKLRSYAKSEAPKPEEFEGKDSIADKVVQGAGQTIPGLIENAPALISKRAAPFVAGAIAAVGDKDKGLYEALGSGVKAGLGWAAMGKAQKLPTLGGRILGSAAAMTLPGALSGESGKDLAASAITGGVLGGLSGKPAERAAAIEKAKSSLVEDMQKVLAPEKLGPNAAATKSIAIPHIADMAQRVDRAHFALKQAREVLEKLPENKANPGGVSDQALDFIDHIETGKQYKMSEEMQPFAKIIRGAFDQRLGEIQKHGRLLDAYVENYFPHLFTNADNAKKAIQILSKKPLEGSKGFLRQRKLMTVKDAMDFAKQNPEYGLKLISNNPVDIALLSLREQDRFITARNILDDMKKNELLKFVKQGDGAKPPEGWTRIDDRFSTVLSPTGQIVGHYYAPSDAAQVMNNYLSPGMNNKPWFRNIMTTANSLNMFQLGFSAFHLGFTTTEAAISQFSLAIEQAVKGIRTGNAGMVGRAAVTAAKTATVPFEPFVAPLTNFGKLTKSNKIMREWIKPGSHPEVANMVEYAKQAGARMQMDPHYKTDLMRNAQAAFKSGKYMQALVKGLPGVTEKMMQPLFDYAVPMQKIGAFHRLAEYEISKLGQNAKEADVRQAMQTAWKSIDNRFGQVVYDNLFWNKTAKDLMMASVRSVGWNYGTLSEIGGGIKDWASAVKKSANGKPFDLTHRMAYTIGLPVVVGTLGSIVNYINTGKAPQSMQDRFFPQTGGKDEFGRPERISLPSYMKDVFGIAKRPGEGTEQYTKRVRGIVQGKMHPFLTSLAEMMENQDWRGGEIRHSDDPFMKQVIDSAKFISEQVIPFSFRYSIVDRARGAKALGGHQSQYSTAQGVASFFGATPAPAFVKQKAYETAEQGYSVPGTATRTTAQLNRSDRIREIERAMRLHDDAETERQKKEGLERGEITEKDIQRAEKEYAIPPGVMRFKRLSMENALSVYFNYVNGDKSIPTEEKNTLKTILARKVLNKWNTIEALPDDDPRKIKARHMLTALNMMDQQGEVTADDEEPDEQ